MKRLFSILSLLALAACAANVQQPVVVTSDTGATVTVTQPAQTPLQKLAAFTVSDLQAASADAHTSNDQAAFQCYDYLVKVIPTIQPSQASGTVGAFLAFQKARDLAHGLNSANSNLTQLNLACAPLVIDTQTTINKLAILGVGATATTATGGVLSPLLTAFNSAVAPLAP